MSPGLTAGVWVVGAITVVLLLEYVPKAGGALLLLLVVYLAMTSMQKGVV